jgi:sugar (pentulose or hexulose) kinase
MTTLAGYIHWKLTGEKVLGVGEASGLFPIDLSEKRFNKEMVQAFNEKIAPLNFPWKLEDILPMFFVAGEKAGELTEEGARLLDVTGRLKPGVPFCPPEGDAGTGMVATNSVACPHRQCLCRHIGFCYDCLGEGALTGLSRNRSGHNA